MSNTNGQRKRTRRGISQPNRDTPAFDGTGELDDEPRGHGGEPMPAYDRESELGVLAALMLSGSEVSTVASKITALDFYRPAHGAIFRAIVALHEQGAPTDPIAVAAELDRRNELTRCGGVPYLHTVFEQRVTAASAGFYADAVLEKAVERGAVEIGTRITSSSAAGGDQFERLVQARAEIDALIDRRTSTSEQSLAADRRAQWLSHLDDLQAGRIEPGLPTGFHDLDDVIGGLKGGQFIVVAGRPGLGKSTLAVDIAREVTLKRNKNTAIYSLEMSTNEVLTRIVAAEAKVRLQDLSRPGTLTPSDYNKISEAWDDIEEGGQLFIDETATITPSQIRAKARQLQAQHGLDLVVVDYLQLMKSGQRSENRQLEVSDISRTLKILARELDVPVIALSQLNRGPEQRSDKRPMLSDLRESGSLEQDADMVILLHRPEIYEEESDRRGEADLILAKHRGGPTATVTVAQQLHYSRFVNLAG